MSKYCIIGDLHFHKYSDYSEKIPVVWDTLQGKYVVSEDSNAKIMNSRLFYLLSALVDVREYMFKNDIHLLLNAGDTFHKRAIIDVETFNAVSLVFETFAYYGIGIISIAGNHDQSTLGDNSDTSVHTLNSDYHKVVETNSVINPSQIFMGTIAIEARVPDVDILCIPWSKNKADTMKYIECFIQSKQEISHRVLLMHCGISGGLIGSGNYTISDEYNLAQLHVDEFKYAHFGHYHKSQILTNNAHYTGSLLANDFGDEGSVNGFWVADLSKRWDLQLVPFEGYPKFITITSDNVEEMSEEVIKDNYVRIQVNASDSDKIVNKVSEISEGSSRTVRVEIEKDYSVNSRSSISITQSTEDVLRRYVQENLPEGIDAEDLIKVGLNIVSTVGGI